MADSANPLRRYLERRKLRRIWGAVWREFMPPPPRAFASFGAGSMIVPPARIEGPEFISIGKNVMIHEHVWLIARQQPGLPPPRLVIGDGVQINRFVKIVSIGEVLIEEDAMIGDNCYISDTHYLYEDPTRSVLEQGLAPSRPVRIGPGCHVAFRSTIRPGVTLEESVHIGSGSVVADDMPARSVVHGDPARVIRRYDPEKAEWVFVRPSANRADEGTADTV